MNYKSLIFQDYKIDIRSPTEILHHKIDFYFFFSTL